MTNPVDDDDLVELYDADIPRIDLVKAGANSMPFLIAKSTDGGLLTADQVREVIAKAAQEGPVTEATPAEDVVKGEPDLDASTVLADPEAGAAGDENMPGSPAWEAVDAATACKWTAILARAKNALTTLADREMIEAAAGESDPSDSVDSWNLQDAASAIDYAIGVLAPFAVGEQLAADAGSEELDEITKAAGAVDTAALDLLEGLAPVIKAGRALSAANEAALRGASEQIQKVLASLPAAPEPTGEVAKSEETDVTKGQNTDVTVNVDPAAVPDHESVVKALRGILGLSDVTKAKGDPQVAVYTADGKLVGTVDQKDISPIASASAPADGDTDQAAKDAAEADTDPAATDGTKSDDGDTAAVIPGTDTVQAPAPAPAPTTDDNTEAVQKAVAAALGEVLAPVIEQLGKHAELEAVAKGLQERVDHLERSPDDRRSPALNGGTGFAGIAPRDGNQADPLADLRKAVEDAATPGEKQDALTRLGYAEIRARFSPR